VKQDRDVVAAARQDADNDAEQDSDEHHQNVKRLQNRAEAREQIANLPFTRLEVRRTVPLNFGPNPSSSTSLRGTWNHFSKTMKATIERKCDRSTMTSHICRSAMNTASNKVEDI
jgi:hypothetical protein